MQRHCFACGVFRPFFGTKKDIVVLLVSSRHQPRLHFFAKCSTPGPDGSDANTLPDVFPFTLSLSIGASRLSRQFRAANIVSSEELAKEMAATRLQWAIHILDWEIPARRQLLDHHVVSIGEAWEKPAPRCKKANTTDDYDFVLPDGDPLEVGRAQARASSNFGASPSTGGPAGASPADGAVPDDEAWAEAELFAELALDELEVLGGEIAGIDFDAGVALGDLEGRDLEDADGSDDDALSDESEGFGTAAASPGGPPEPEAAGVSPEEAVRICNVSKTKFAEGYVSCSAAPWSMKHVCGRLTSWPPNIERFAQNVQMTCWMHPKCKTSALGGWRVTDDELLHWLFQGVPVAAGDSPEDAAAKTQAHRSILAERSQEAKARVWATEEAEAPAGGAASSSGAS